MRKSPRLRVGREWMALTGSESSCEEAAAEMSEDRCDERGRCRLKLSEFHSKDAVDVTTEIEETLTVESGSRKV